MITIGQIVNTHGVLGEVRVVAFSDNAERFENEDYLYAISPMVEEKKVSPNTPNHGPIKLTIETVRYHKGLAMLTFEEIPDLTAAEKIKGWYVQVPEESLPKLPDGTYYIFQLIGLDVYEEDKYLGKITDVMQPGANDVYVVSLENEPDLLIPVTPEVRKSVDLENKIIKVVLPKGLYELYRK